MLDLSPSKVDIFLVAAIVLLLVAILYNHRRSVFKPKSESVSLGVSDLIEKVKSELITSETERIKVGKPALFEVKDLDLEINYVVKENYQGSGSFELKVITVGGETDISSEKTQKVRLHFTVAQPQTKDSKVSPTFPQVDEAVIVSDPTPEPKK